MGMVTRVLIRGCLDVQVGQGWGGLGWGVSDFLRFLSEVRNHVYCSSTHVVPLVHQGLQEVFPKRFQKCFRFGGWFRVVPLF
jgi:hypothetical protein